MSDKNENLANEFLDAIRGHSEQSLRRGLPPMHPREKDERWIDTTDEEIVERPKNLLSFPRRKLQVRFGCFNLTNDEEREALQEIENNCLNIPGWVLVNERWNTNKTGDTIVTIKYLEPVKGEGKKKASVEDAPPTDANA